MQSPEQFDDAVGVFKRYGRRRTRKSYWRKLWIALTDGATLEARAIKQTMRCPKLLSASMPRVILKEEFLQRPRSPESEFPMWFKPPAERVALANFIGAATAAGIDADAAEAEFFRLKRLNGEVEKMCGDRTPTEEKAHLRHLMIMNGMDPNQRVFQVREDLDIRRKSRRVKFTKVGTE
jgi:hypothetical protein